MPYDMYIFWDLYSTKHAWQCSNPDKIVNIKKINIKKIKIKLRALTIIKRIIKL